jgi:hypothetical protein
MGGGRGCTDCIQGDSRNHKRTTGESSSNGINTNNSDNSNNTSNNKSNNSSNNSNSREGPE